MLHALRLVIRHLIVESENSASPSIERVRSIYKLEHMLSLFKQASKSARFKYRATRLMSATEKALKRVLAAEISALARPIGGHWIGDENQEEWEESWSDSDINTIDEATRDFLKAFEALKSFDGDRKKWRKVHGDDVEEASMNLVFAASKMGIIDLIPTTGGFVETKMLLDIGNKLVQSLQKKDVAQLAKDWVAHKIELQRRMRDAPKTYREIRDRLKKPRGNLVDDLVLFNMMLNAVHERGITSRTVYGEHSTELDKLSRGPDPAWTNEARELLLSNKPAEQIWLRI